MGAITDHEEDQRAVKILQQLPEEAKDWIRHHFRNCLLCIGGGAEIHHPDMIMSAAKHLVEDLKRIGC
jgi:hypothetical protein